MALDINGYNPTFNEFVQFAQRNVNVGDDKAIASAKIQKGPLDGRKIVAVTNSLTDEVHKWMRTNDEYAVNDRTRAIFKAAIINMFGGESKIPASVKKAMILSDYDCGKPLTARRILAVKAAIDADGTAKARSAKIRLETFSPETKTSALNLGFYRHELPRLARATHFYMQATGLSELEAMVEVGNPGSKANRLMSYGGRFMESPENFADGLRLMDLFDTWHGDLCNATAALKQTGTFRSGRAYTDANTPSQLNAEDAAVKPEARLAMEKFVFEQLAIDPNANLKETDGEAIFGFENNDATRFVGQNFGNSCLNTVGNIPPAKRAVVFKAFNLFCNLATNAQEAKEPVKRRLIGDADRPQFLGRILRHLDGILDLDAKGKLTAKNVIKLCFPDMVAQKMTGNYDCKALNEFFDRQTTVMSLDEDAGGKYSHIAGPLQMVMEQTGATLEEAAESLKPDGNPIPNAPYVSGGQQPITEYASPDGGRKQLRGDLNRPVGYVNLANRQDLLPDGPDKGFGFTFPGEERFVTNGTHLDNIRRVENKIQQMCGPAHERQASSVMLMVSQSGLGMINGALRPYGIQSTEHSAVDFALSKDEKTGIVTIRYNSPAELPFRFEWTATVDTDGKVTTTPMKFEKPVDMNVGVAGKYVDNAVKTLGVKLTKSQKAMATALLAAHGTNMYAKNARLLAQFIVKLPLTDASANSDTTLVTDMAKTIRKWRDFGFDERGMGQLKAALKTQANVILAENFASTKFDAGDPTIYTTMKTDSNRATFIVNGKEIVSQSGDHGAPLVAAIKQAIPGANAQKAVSALLNQETVRLVGYPQNRIAYPAGPGQDGEVDTHTIPGTEKLANRNLANGLYQVMFNGSNTCTYDLQVSEDGSKATITSTYANTMTVGTGENPLDEFGTFTVQTRLVIDLSAEVPTIIDASFAQSID